MTPCKHPKTYSVAEEISRLYGNNYDIVTIRLDEYCDICDHHINQRELTRRENRCVNIFAQAD